MHLQPRPGTDAALALGMARVIVHAGLHDAAFLERHATGFDRYLDACAATRWIASRRSPACRGIDRTPRRSDYARHKPALLIAGFGLQRHHRAGPGDARRGAAAGADRQHRRGGRRLAVRQPDQPRLQDPPLPPEPPGVRRAIPVSRLGPALDELDAPAVSAAWIEKGNPASQNPRSNLVRDALTKIDFVVVVDQFMTDTARLAHIVLPAKTMFEEEDLVTAYWHPYLQRRAKLWDPPGEVKTETDIWRLLSERFGFDTSWFPHRRGRAALAAPDAPGPVSMEDLAQRPVDPTGRGDIAFADLRFATPSGRSSSHRTTPRACGAWIPCPTTCRWTRGTSRRAPRAIRCNSSRARRGNESTRSSAISTGCATWNAPIVSTCTRPMRPRAAWRRATSGGVERSRADHAARAHRPRPAPGRRPRDRGRCHDGDPDVNVLTDAGVTDINHGATFYECLVEVAAGDKRLSAGRTRPAGPKPRGRPSPGTTASGHTPRRQQAPSRGFSLDLGRCVGCGACVLACRLENGWSSDNPWRRVIPLNLARRTAGPTYFMSVACHHCERPACLAACPRRLREAPGRRGGAPRVAVPRLPVLRDGLPVRRPALRRATRRHDEVPPLPPPAGRGRGAGLRGGVPDRGARELDGSGLPASGVRPVGVPGLGPTGAVSGEPASPASSTSPDARRTSASSRRADSVGRALRCPLGRNLRGPR